MNDPGFNWHEETALEFAAQRDSARAENARLRELVALKDKLLAAYRTGKAPSGQTLDRIAVLRKALSL